MRSVKDVEAYLGRLGRKFDTVEDQPGTFVIRRTKTDPAVALRVEPPLVVARVDVGDSQQGSQGAVDLYRTLLETNAKSLVHTSFGLEGSRVVLSAALELENLDFNELEAVLDEMDLTLAREVPKLRSWMA